MSPVENWLTSPTFQWCVGTAIGLAGVWLAYLQVRAHRRGPGPVNASRISGGTRVPALDVRHPHTPTAGIYGVFERTGYLIFALLAGGYAASLDERRNARVRTGAFVWCAVVGAACASLILLIADGLPKGDSREAAMAAAAFIFLLLVFAGPSVFANGLIYFYERAERHAKLAAWIDSLRPATLSRAEVEELEQLPADLLAKYFERFEDLRARGLDVKASHMQAHKSLRGCAVLLILTVPLACAIGLALSAVA